MDTRHLRAFLKIADTGSITRAAESLGIAQPSLSQQLLRLEDEVGFALFRRTARGVALTEAGRVFQEHARQILRGTEQAVEDLRELDAEASGQVILAVPYSISRLAGVALVDAFLRHAPQVSFRLVEATTGSIRGWLDAGKIDLGILNDLGPLRHLSSRPLASEALYLIGPSGEFGNDGELPAIAPEALAGLPLILPGLPHGLRQLIESRAERLGIALNVRQDLDALAHVAPLIALGHGYSLLPLAAVADDLAAGDVSAARIRGEPFRRSLLLVRNSGKVVTHASVRCEDLTLKVLTSLIDKGVWRAEADAALR